MQVRDDIVARSLSQMESDAASDFPAKKHGFIDCVRKREHTPFVFAPFLELMSYFSMSRLVSKCIAEFGAAAPFALRSGHAPTSEGRTRLMASHLLDMCIVENRGPTHGHGGRRRRRGDALARANRDLGKRRSPVYPTVS